MTTSEPRPTPGFLLWRLTMKWRAAVDRAVAPVGLTHAQYSVLASLYGMVRAGQRPSQRALADHTGLEPVYISKLARTLERAGLVQRLGNPTDTRAVQLALTPHGIDIVQQAIKIVLDLQEQLTAPLGGTGSERTRALMDDLQTLLSATPLETRGETYD